jgi:hypothetical protein
MTDYTDLIERLRGNDMPWSVKDAADALEAQAGRIAELEKMLAVHRLAVDVDALKARIAELGAALKPFSLQKLSTEPHTTTLMYYTPIGELARQAREIKKRDDEIRAARAALGEK